jgi:hypothetical protein
MSCAGDFARCCPRQWRSEEERRDSRWHLAAAGNGSRWVEPVTIDRSPLSNSAPVIAA